MCPPQLPDIPHESSIKSLVSRDRLRPRNDTWSDAPHWCSGCHRITELRECWGCKKWFCYDCLIEHMMVCPEWQKIKGDYEIIFECDKHETCDDCPLRFKCYTERKIPRKK